MAGKKKAVAKKAVKKAVKKAAKPAKKAAPAKKPETGNRKQETGNRKPATAKKAAKPAKAKPAKAKPVEASGISPVEKPPASPASSDFLALVEVFTERPGVTRARMMGCEGLRVGAKYFAMEWRGELVVKLPRDTVDAYAASGRGTHFDPGMGRPMKEWLTVPPGVADWRNLAEQAFAFVSASL